MEAIMKIRSIDRDINDILKSGFYRIPRFQRPYSWDRENIEDFWNDIVVNSHEADPEIGEEKEALEATFSYFSGNLNATPQAILGDKSLTPAAMKAKVGEKLAEIRNKLLALKVIYIDLDNEDDAYLIFET